MEHWAAYRSTHLAYTHTTAAGHEILPACRVQMLQCKRTKLTCGRYTRRRRSSCPITFAHLPIIRSVHSNRQHHLRILITLMTCDSYIQECEIRVKRLTRSPSIDVARGNLSVMPLVLGWARSACQSKMALRTLSLPTILRTRSCTVSIGFAVPSLLHL